MKTKHYLSIYTMSIDSLAYIRIQWLSLAFFPLTSKFSQYFLVFITVSLCLMLHCLPTSLFYCYINYEATIWLIFHHFLQILSWVKLISISHLCVVWQIVSIIKSLLSSISASWRSLVAESACWGLFLCKLSVIPYHELVLLRGNNFWVDWFILLGS